MKLNPVLILFSIAFSALFGYLVYSITQGEGVILLSVLSTISFLVISISGFGLKIENNHANANAKVLASVFFAIALIVAIILGLSRARTTAIIIATSIVLLLYLLVLYVLPKKGI